MPVYLWEVRTLKGEVKKGEQEAPDEAAPAKPAPPAGYRDIKVKKKPKDLLEYIPFSSSG